jgi:hypothetical protein
MGRFFCAFLRMEKPKRKIFQFFTNFLLDYSIDVEYLLNE